MARRKKDRTRSRLTKRIPSRSNAIKRFAKNKQDLQRLLDLHVELTGVKAGRRRGFEVLHKAGVLILYGCWEAFIEDLLTETILRIISQSQSPNTMPDSLKKYLKKHLDATKHEHAVWGLADSAWRKEIRLFLSGLTEVRNLNFNAATPEKIDKLYEDAVGLTISSAWHWKKMSIERSRTKLTEFVSLRGSVAHRIVASSPIQKRAVEDYANFITKLVSTTDTLVMNSLRNRTFGTVTRVSLARIAPKV